MMQAIVLSATTRRIGQVAGWGMGLIVALLVWRALNDFMAAFDDPEMGLKEAFRRSRKRIYASLIALTIESLVLFIQQFY